MHPPKNKIYEKRTIEFGVWVEHTVFNQIKVKVYSQKIVTLKKFNQEFLKNTGDNKPIKAVVKLIHQIFSQLEPYLTHDSLLDAQGPTGFQPTIKAIKILKVWDDT